MYLVVLSLLLQSYTVVWENSEEVIEAFEIQEYGKVFPTRLSVRNFIKFVSYDFSNTPKSSIVVIMATRFLGIKRVNWLAVRSEILVFHSELPLHFFVVHGACIKCVCGCSAAIPERQDFLSFLWYLTR